MLGRVLNTHVEILLTCENSLNSRNIRHFTPDLDHSITMNPCLLSCYNEEEQKFYLDKKMPNGERCHDGEHNNICVYGKCQVQFQTFCQLTVWSSCPKVLCEKGILKNFAIFAGKHLCWRLFLILFKTFLKRDSNTCVFLWILQNF